MSITTFKIRTIFKKIRKYPWTPQIGLFILLIASIYIINTMPSSQAGTVEDAMSLVIGENILNVEVADTEQARMKGLSGRRSLSEDDVLLFSFADPGKYGIWMKDMHFSIDILWLEKMASDKKGRVRARIVDMATRISPSTYPFVFTPHKNADYILEANEGFVTEHDLKIDSVLEFKENSTEE